MSSQRELLINMQDVRIYDKQHKLISENKKDLTKGQFIAYYSVSENMRYILRETISKIYNFDGNDCIDFYVSRKCFIKYDETSTLWYLVPYEELKLNDIVALTLEGKVADNENGGYLVRIVHQSTWGRGGYNSEPLTQEEEYEYLNKVKEHPLNFFKRN